MVSLVYLTTNKGTFVLITPTGRFELDGAKFKERVKKTGNGSCTLDFRTLFPDFFSGQSKMPRHLGLIWRNPVDSFLDHDKGNYYFQEKECLVLFTFDNIAKGMAKAKVDNIGAMIKKAFKESIDRGDNPTEISDSPASAPKPAKKEEGDESLKKVLEGLGKNPSIDEVKIWADRALQNLHLSKSESQDMLKLQKEYKICYVPLWNAGSNALIGANCELNPYGTPASHEGQVVRDNFAQIGKACQEIARLQAKKMQALMIVPIYVKTILEKEVTEFLVTYLRKTPEPVRKSIIFELRGVEKNQIPIAAKASLEPLSFLCRAVIVDTGILTQPDMGNEPFKIHAYGCNYNDLKLPAEQKLNLMKKYANTYKARGVKTYIRNLPDAATIAEAQKLGYTYITAPSVINPRISCPSASRMSLQDMKTAKKPK